MAHELVCWRCGASLAALTLPLRRQEECPGCRAQLHVCRMCQSWAPTRPKKCREDDAEEVRNKDLANFCDWFKPRPAAFDAAGAAAEAAARAQLDDLFGGPKRS
jgi:ribosomal protein L40E